jgi:hypothetical protein
VERTIGGLPRFPTVRTLRRSKREPADSRKEVYANPTPKAVWHVIREHAPKVAIEDSHRTLRRTGARLSHAPGGELEQIQFLLGHNAFDQL